ncbi:GatB/YqeY domain-containing protein [Arcobacter sp. HD9-500m-PIT-SAG02]|nr:GatB/YqeY domain-containing protein [Arcobacter sp. HD9-500m-PIT-SAG02]
MSLKELLKSDLKAAMRAKEIIRRDCIRAINTMIKQIEVDERRDLDDAEVLKLIQRGIKQRMEAATAYNEAGRSDLEEKELAQVEIFKTYLPQQLSDEELESKTKTIIENVGASSMKDMGKVMGLASKEFAGVANGKRINEMVKKLLG